MKKQLPIIAIEKRSDGSIFPADGESASIWAEMKTGKWKFTYTKWKESDRKLYRHRRYFKMISLAWENQSKFPTKESLRRAVLIEAGFFSWEHRFNILNPEDVTSSKVADSMAFAKMSQEEFERCYYLSVQVLLNAFGWEKNGNMHSMLMSFL